MSKYFSSQFLDFEVFVRILQKGIFGQDTPRTDRIWTGHSSHQENFILSLSRESGGIRTFNLNEKI